MAAKISKTLASCSLLITRRLRPFNFKPELQVSHLKVQVEPGAGNRFFHYHSKAMASEGTEVNTSAEQSEGNVKPDMMETSTDAMDVNQGQEKEEAAPGPEASQSGSEPKSEEAKPFVRVPKVKAAILLSYSGQGYFGMQMQNNGTKTIENDLMQALFDSGIIDKEGFEKPKIAKFQRAARTDKNVSAARNIVSMMVPKTFDPDVVNKQLPDQIRIMDFKRVTKGFDAKLACNARTYLYMIPTFAFAPLEEKVVEEYRMPPDILAKLRETLKKYEGSKNYHNFTSRKKPTDPSAMRFIMHFTSSEPFEKDGLEYVVLEVRGQSFMLHQIRKMIGLVVAMLRGYASEETHRKCFTLERVDIPMAPGLGLMLGEAHYDNYNTKFGKDGIHEPLVWDNVAEKIEQFCQDKIYTVVTKTENEEKSFLQWLTTVAYHTYDVRDEDDKGNFGPLGKTHLHLKKIRGEGSDVEDEEEGGSDGEVPKKKLRQD